MKSRFSLHASSCQTCGAALQSAKPTWIQLELSAVPVRYRKVFENAATRLNTIITQSPRFVQINGAVNLVGIKITAKVSQIDGLGKILGQAGPTAILSSDGLPVLGIMDFDIADIDNMEKNGTLADVIIHEMAHCLGFGTLFEANGLIKWAGTSNPVYIGSHAVTEYGVLTGNATIDHVPLADTGGPGTREGHWRERTFGDELFTGYISGQIRPISRMSVASFKDLGYEVNMLAADPYTLPQPGSFLRQLASYVPVECERPEFIVVEDRQEEGIFIDAAA